MRSLKRHRALPALNSLEQILECPAGHKYEVVGISVGGDLVVAYTWYIFGTLGGTLTVLDQINVPSTAAAVYRPYEALVLNAGDDLTVIDGSASSTAASIVVQYVDVSPV